MYIYIYIYIYIHIYIYMYKQVINYIHAFSYVTYKCSQARQCLFVIKYVSVILHVVYM